MSESDVLPVGVELREVPQHGDHRGMLTEAFRETWDLCAPVQQWDLQRSRPRVLRGVHVHLRRDDFLVVASGRMVVGLHDLRRDQPTEGRAATIELDPDAPTALVIPHGVAHGFYFPVETVLLQGLTRLYDATDEFGCRWDDPGLGLRWSVVDPILSERDRAAPPLAELVSELAAHQPLGA